MHVLASSMHLYDIAFAQMRMLQHSVLCGFPVLLGLVNDYVLPYLEKDILPCFVSVHVTCCGLGTSAWDPGDY